MTLTNYQQQNIRTRIEELINAEELDKKIEATLEYIKRFNEPEDGDWVVWAYEFVSGAHGQYTTRIFIQELTGVSEESLETFDMDTLLEALHDVGEKVAEVFQKRSKLPGKFYVGNNEADGSLGVFYYIQA